VIPAGQILSIEPISASVGQRAGLHS
jgi:hypothetical protein